MNYLSNPTVLSVGSILIFLLYSFIQIQLQKKSLAKSRQDGLRIIIYLRKLLESVPQHRGMVNALLQGDDSFRSKISAVQQTIGEHIKLLLNENRLLHNWEVANLLQNIENEWQAISQHYTQYDAATSFSKHTELVSNILYLLNETAAESGILADHLQYKNMAVVANQDLPLITELLGQARGIGTGVAAKGSKTSTDRVKLLYRLDKLNSVVTPMTNNLKNSLNQNGLVNSTALNLLSSCQEKTAEFIRLLDDDLINSNKIQINAETYYSAGTDAINSNFVLLDTVNELIQEQINKEL